MTTKTVPHAAIDKFHSLLVDDDAFNEACMRVALKVAQSYNPGQPLEQEDYDLAYELVERLSVS
jgi:hypothetical protein